MRKTFITGGTGFLGANLVADMAARKEKTVVLIRESSDLTLLKAIASDSDIEAFIEFISFASNSEIPDILDRVRPDGIIHVAAKGGHQHNTEDIPALVNANIELGAMLLEGAHVTGKRTGVPIPLVFCGSYFQHAGETIKLHPNSFYAATKTAFEMLAHYYNQVLHNPVMGIKFYDIYGLYDRRKRIVDLIFASLNADEPLRLSGGEQKLRLLNVDDAVNALIYALELLSGDDELELTYGAGGDEYVSIKELVAIIENITQKVANVEWGAIPYRNSEIFNPIMLKRMPSWKPRVSLKSGLSRRYDLWKNELSKEHGK